METPLRAIIVDDESVARDHLRDRLKVHSNVRIVGEADSVAMAVRLCENLKPNLIFLDVDMPRANGFALLPKLNDPLPAIIFVTGYNEFAVRAFEINAADYLLKPVDPARLHDAIARVIHTPQPTQTRPFQLDDQMLLRSDARIRPVFVTDITSIKSEQNYTQVCVDDGTSMLIRRGMSEWEALLPNPPFERVCRFYIINLDAIVNVCMESYDEIQVEIKGNPSPIHFQRPLSDQFLKCLKNFNR